MRTALMLVPFALLIASSALAQSQAAPGVPGRSRSPQPDAPSAPAETVGAGEIDFGVRLTSISGDRGRYQRLRDLQSGPTLDRLRYVRDQETWAFNAAFDHVGYRDQRYFASLERYGKVRASFEWNQMPLSYGDASQTPFRTAVAGVFRLDDAMQAALQNRTGTLADYARELRGGEPRSRRDVAAARLTYSVTPQLDLHTSFTSTARGGDQPWGASFGFSNANEVALTVDSRTSQLASAVEWASPRGMARLAYDGAWFDNGVEALVWDNPLRFTDHTHAQGYSAGDASSQGRMALSPDSTAHTVSASGSVALPARSRALAYVSIGTWLQDERLLPHTINTAIAPIPLPRETAAAEALVTSLTYRFTSRPTSALWVNGQYRLYDFDNRTPHFEVGQYVRLDGNVAQSVTGGSHAFAYTRHFADLDLSFTPFRYLAFRGGYGQQHDDRTYRLFEETTDRTVRASIDSAALTWGSIRFQYDHSERTGKGLDEEVLSEIGEQVSLRQFDIADRLRDRVTAIVQVVPLPVLGVHASIALGREERPESAFGLQDNDLRAFSTGVDVTPTEAFTASLSYGVESYATRQQSRQANPGEQFNDPTRDWWTDMDERVHTLSFSVDAASLTERTRMSLAYDYVGSRARYVYKLGPETTLAQPQPLRPVRNVFHVAKVDLRQTLTRQLALGVGYRFDRYEVDDFALSPGTLNSPLIPTYMNLMNQWRPYAAHTGSVRLIYAW
jgi:MtrB/PioB family decaheme-associated outer membrane protein